MQISEEGAWRPPARCCSDKGHGWVCAPRSSQGSPPLWRSPAPFAAKQKQNNRRKQAPLSLPALWCISSILHWQSTSPSQLAKEKYYLQSHKVPESQSEAKRGRKFTTGTKVKGNHREWERIFATCITVKGLIYRRYKECLQINKEKIQITQ